MAFPNAPGGAPMSGGAFPEQSGKLGSAIEFLDKVKQVYIHQPKVYTDFLDIMKGFKTHTIDTTGVIKKVKQLFVGHPELTRGFAAFLPQEYKLEAQSDEDDDLQGTGMQIDPSQHAMAPNVQSGLVSGRGSVSATPVQVPVNHVVTPQQQHQQQQQAAPEVGEEHARIYVKKIKTRFANQPQIYKSFLDILHTFHREKHTIQDVYSQVATLFQDHPDLLAEFSQFLPDTTGQATTQLGATQQQHYPQHDDGSHHSAQPKVNRGGRRGMGGMTESVPIRSTSRNQAQAMGTQSLTPGMGMGSRGVVGSMASRGIHGNQIQGSISQHAMPGQGGSSVDPSANKERSHGTFDELAHFLKLRHVLPQNDYEEFLKLLSMYNADVLSKGELYMMVRDLLRHVDLDLLDWFRRFIQVEEMKEDEPQGFLADFDWTMSEKLGPSYRAMPRTWASWRCSGRAGNAICQEVLNDSWISVPRGSEEGAFKNSRKNQYEELLFRCEDDRFELDLLVEANATAIRHLELLLQQLKAMSPQQLAIHQLSEGDVDVMTIRAIKRVYSTRADEFIKMMMGKPAFTVPVILARLKAKDTEWNVARREWNVLWKQIFKKNYHKSLDHRSTIFKQEEKKLLTPKSLFSELKKAPPVQASQATSAGSLPNGHPVSVGGVTTSSGVVAAAAVATNAIAIGAMPASETSQRMDIDEHTTPSTSDGAVTVNTAAVKVELDSNSTVTPAAGFTTDSNATASLSTNATASTTSTASGTAASSSAVPNGYSNIPPAPTLRFKISPGHIFADMRHLLLVTFQSQLPKVDLLKVVNIWDNVISSFFHVDMTIGTMSPSLPPKPLKDPKSSRGMDVDGNVISSNKPISTELASPSTNHALLLGNDSFYLAIRYLQILYDRLNDAWNFSEEFPPIRHPPIIDIDIGQSNGINAAANGKSTSNDPNSMDSDEAGVGHSALTRYKTFLQNIEMLLIGVIDLPSFEEECRNMFGVSSFPLYTIDRLLFILAKQLVSLYSEETSEKLAALYKYETSRNMGRFSDSVYLTNCRELLSGDKKAFVFMYDWSLESQILGITEIDLGHPPFGSEHNEEISRYINSLALTTEPPSESKQINTDTEDKHHHAPFLKRNIATNTSDSAENAQGSPEMNNELGIKIVSGSYKLRFVGGTEDYLQRPGRPSEHHDSTDKIELPALEQNAALPDPIEH